MEGVQENNMTMAETRIMRQMQGKSNKNYKKGVL